MSGRGTSPGLFGIVGGLLWGVPRNVSLGQQEVGSSEDNKQSGLAPTISSKLEKHQHAVNEDTNVSNEIVNSAVDGDSDDNVHSASDCDNETNGPGESEVEDDALTYEGELISEMAYRTMQLHLKSMGIKCTGKKEHLLKSLKAAVQSGSADRLRSLRHSSPMHPYDSTRTPKRKHVSSPSAHSQTQSSPPTTRSTRSRRERGRQTKNSSGMVPGLDIPGDSAVKGRPKRRSTRTSDAEDSIPATPASGRASGGKGSVPGKSRASARARRKAVEETPPASEEDESEEDGASPVSLKGITIPRQALKLYAPAVVPLPPRIEGVDVAGGEGSDSEPFFSSEESPVRMPAPAQVLHIGAISSARIDKVPSSVGGSAGGEGTGSVDLANVSTVSTGGGSSIKGEDGEDGASLIDSMSAIDAVSVAATVGSMPDEERVAVDLADLPLATAQPSVGGAASRPTALDAIGRRFIEMLKGEGPEMSEAEFKIYQSLLESKRHGPAAAAVSEAMKSLGSIMSPTATGTIRPGSTGSAASMVPPQFEAGGTARSDISGTSMASPREGNSDSEREGLRSLGGRRGDAGQESLEESFDLSHATPSSRKRSVVDADLSGADLAEMDWRRRGSAGSSHGDDDEYSQQGRHKRQYRGVSSEPYAGYSDGWTLPAYRDSTEGGGGGDRMSMMSNDASYLPPYYSSGGGQREAYEPPPPPQWQQDRDWMAPRHHSYLPPQRHQQQTSPRYSTHSVIPSAYTPRFQESGRRFSQSSLRVGYGQPASSGMAPVSLQVQQHKSLTSDISSVQRRLMKRRLAGTSHSSSDGSYSGSYGITRGAAATASGAVAKRILDTLGDITSSLDEQRRKPLPVATPSASSTKRIGGGLTSAEPTRNSVRFAAGTTDGQHALRKVGFVATPTSSDSSSTAVRNRKGTPHGAAAGLSTSCSAARSPSPDDEDNYDDRRASTSSDQLWSRQTGRGQSLSPPAPQSKAGSANGSNSRASAAFEKDADDSDDEFQFVSPTRIEGLEDDDMDVVQSKNSSVHFAFSPPGKTKGPKKMIDRPATPAAALKTAKALGGVADVPVLPAMTSPGSRNMSDENCGKDKAPLGSGFVESIWKRPNTVQCEVCLVYNEENATKCVSCESKMGTAPDTSRRPDATAPTSAAAAGASGSLTGFGVKGTSGAASNKTAAKSSGFTFGAPKPAHGKAVDSGSTADDLSKQSAVSFSGSKMPSSGFQFGSALKANATKDSSSTDDAKTATGSLAAAAPAAATVKVSFGFTAGTSKEATTAASSAPSIAISSDKKFSGFSFSSSAKSKSADPAPSTADSSGDLPQIPATTLDTPAASGGQESFNVPPVTASKPAFGFLSGSKSQSVGDTPKPQTASFGVTGSASSASSGMDFTKNISSSSISSGFAFGSKKTINEPNAQVSNSTSVAADEQLQGREEDDEGRGRKRANVSTDTATASAPSSSGFSFGKGTASLNGASSTPTLISTPSAATGTMPAFGFLSSASKQPPTVIDTTGETPKPSGGVAFQTNTPAPAAATKTPSTSFKFGSSAASETPVTTVKGPFGSGSTGPSASAPFGASSASGNAPKVAVTGVFGSGGAASGLSSFSFAPSKTAAATSTGVSFKFGQTTTQPASSGSTPTPTSAAVSGGFKGFGGFSGSTATPAKATAPPPPYGSESPGSGMDTGYASGDASNMSTGALPPVATQTPAFGSSTFGSFGGGASNFGSSQSNGSGGTSSAFGSSSTFGSGSGGFSMGAAPKPASFGSTQGSFTSSFGQSSFPQQQSGVATAPASGFSLGSTDKKQQPGRRKLKAKKFA